MKNRILAALLTFAAAATVACGGGDNHNNSNHSNANANRASNANAATNANANANANANRAINGNMSRADYDREKAYYEGEARKSGRTIGSGANDMWLWTKVKAQLATADDLRDSTINVDVENDVVTLSGSVGNGNQKIRAADIAKKTDGVKSVNNKLTISAAGGSNANNANRRS